MVVLVAAVSVLAVITVTTASAWRTVKTENGAVAVHVIGATVASLPASAVTTTTSAEAAARARARVVAVTKARAKAKAKARAKAAARRRRLAAPVTVPVTVPPTAPAPTVPPTAPAPAPPPPAPAPPPPPPPTSGCGWVGANSMESQFLSLLNATRARAGLGPLAWDGGLAGVARNWSVTMSTSSLHHNGDLTGTLTSCDPGWGLGGENVGVGPTVPSLDTAFDNSPEHYANIVNPGFTRVGIGVVVVNGTIWVTFDFVRI